MRIAIVNERWTAGATRCARDLQRGLEHRHTIKYFPERDVFSPAEYLRAIEDFDPDIVHLHSFYGDLPYSFLAQVAQKFPIAFTPHDPRPIGNAMLKCWDCIEFGTCFKCPLVGNPKRYSLFKHDYYWDRLAKRRVHSQLPTSSTVICVSDWMRKRVQQTELARLRVEVIHNGINLGTFIRSTEARSQLGLAPEAKVIAFIAHHSGWKVDERKGVQVLARALAEVVIPKFPELVVLAVGGGMIPNLPNVRPIGYVGPDRISQYYSAADIFVAPSLADNLPYTVLEAMGCGVPVVGSNIGGIPEEIDNDVTGKLFPPGDWQELGNALVHLLENPTICRTMGIAARTRAEEKFAMDQFIRKHEVLFESMLQLHTG